MTGLMDLSVSEVELCEGNPCHVWKRELYDILK